jgi:hypothetical protein
LADVTHRRSAHSLFFIGIGPASTVAVPTGALQGEPPLSSHQASLLPSALSWASSFLSASRGAWGEGLLALDGARVLQQLLESPIFTVAASKRRGRSSVAILRQ